MPEWITRTVSCVGALVIACVGGAGLAAPVNVGTLSCTLTPATEEREGTDLLASCSFEGLKGRKAFFDGSVARIGEESRSTARIVLIWSVQAPELEVPLRQLEGEYAGVVAPEAADEAPTSLKGGRDNAIELVPLTPEPGALPGAALSVLRLTLSTMRT